MIRLNSAIINGYGARKFAREVAGSFKNIHYNSERLTIQAAAQKINDLVNQPRGVGSAPWPTNVDSDLVKYYERLDHREGIQGDLYSTRTNENHSQLSKLPEGFQDVGYYSSPVNLNKLGIASSKKLHQPYGTLGQVTRLFHTQSYRPYSTDPKDKEPAPDSGQTASAQATVSSEGTLSQKDRLKRAVKEYGSTVIVFHVCISLMSLGGFYVAVSSGVDMVAILSKMGVGESILQSKAVAGAGTFVMAYAVHKVFAPARIAITLTSTPFIVRYLRGIGFLKPPKPKV